MGIMRESSVFRNERKQHDLELIKEGKIFNGDKGKKPYLIKNEKNPDGNKHPKADFLMNSRNNLYHQIADEVVVYFNDNKITFHHLEGDPDFGKCVPSGHTLSSQISCLNHLFPFRKDKKAVEEIFGISDAVKIDDGYIALEFVNNNKSYLKESYETRGKSCTSIDAFVKANKIGIGIEWKYTETDCNVETAKVYWKQMYIERYKPLLENSNIIDNDSLISCQMYYELMRQTLLLEQMTDHNEIADYRNIVVCPKNNKELYKCCQEWSVNLKDDSKFEVIDPKDLFRNVDRDKYGDLINYLETRYW